MRCSGSQGPMVRMIAPPTLLIQTRSQRCDSARSTVAARPAATLANDFAALRTAERRLFRFLPMRRDFTRDLQIEDHFAEHLASFEARQAAFEIGEFDLGVDHRQHAT